MSRPLCKWINQELYGEVLDNLISKFGHDWESRNVQKKGPAGVGSSHLELELKVKDLGLRVI